MDDFTTNQPQGEDDLEMQFNQLPEHHPHHQMPYDFEQFYPPPNYEQPYNDQMGAYYAEHPLPESEMAPQQNAAMMPHLTQPPQMQQQPNQQYDISQNPTNPENDMNFSGQMNQEIARCVESRKAANALISLAQQKQAIENHLSNMQRQLKFNLEPTSRKDYDICGLCEKPLQDGKQQLRCASRNCGNLYHRECVFQYMTVKHVLRLEPDVYEFICEHCILGDQKCSCCLQRGDKMVKCRVKGCGRKYHIGDCANMAQAADKREAFVCKAHFCDGCKKPIKTTDKVTRCVRCYKAYHQFEFAADTDLETQIQAAKQQCFPFDKCIPISSDKFVCREHLADDVKPPVGNSEQLLSWSAMCSLHNQNGSIRSQEKREPDLKAADAEVSGQLRAQGFSRQDILFKQADGRTAVTNPEETLYTKARVNLNVFFSQHKLGSPYGHGLSSILEMDQFRDYRAACATQSAIEDIQEEKRQALSELRTSGFFEYSREDFREFLAKLSPDCLSLLTHDEIVKMFINFHNAKIKLLPPQYRQRGHLNQGLAGKTQLDGAEVTMPSLQALDLVDDLIEARMRENWIAEQDRPELESQLRVLANGSSLESLYKLGLKREAPVEEPRDDPLYKALGLHKRQKRINAELEKKVQALVR